MCVLQLLFKQPLISRLEGDSEKLLKYEALITVGLSLYTHTLVVVTGECVTQKQFPYEQQRWPTCSLVSVLLFCIEV